MDNNRTEVHLSPSIIERERYALHPQPVNGAVRVWSEEEKKQLNIVIIAIIGLIVIMLFWRTP